MMRLELSDGFQIRSYHNLYLPVEVYGLMGVMK